MLTTINPRENFQSLEDKQLQEIITNSICIKDQVMFVYTVFRLSATRKTGKRT